MRRSRRTRALAALLALLMQGLGLALLIQYRGAPDPAPSLTWIDLRVAPLRPLTPPPPLPPPRSEPNPRTPSPTTPTWQLDFSLPVTPRPPPAPPDPPPPGRSITLSVNDWYEAAASGAARMGAELEARRAGKGDPLDGEPDVMELPKPAPEPYPRVQRMENGDIQVRTRNGAICTHEQLSLAESFSPWAKGRPVKCTLPSGADSGIGEKLDALKPRYLRGELPLPREGAKKAEGDDDAMATD